MNAPLIWIGIPVATALVLLFFSRWREANTIVGTLVATLLALTAWLVPIGEVVRIGPLAFQLSGTLTILGRQLILESSDRPLLIFIYLGSAFWFAGARVAGCGPAFVPLGIGVSALLTAALFVEPFLYAAIIIELAVLASIPLVHIAGESPGRGVLRFLTFQTLGMPFILFSGWILAGVESNPGNTDLGAAAAVLTALGFGLVMGIFPFNSWIPMLAEEAQPYASAFVFFILSLAVSLFGLNFLSRYTWFYTSTWLLIFLRLSGFLMAVTGGLGAMFQRNIGRLMGYAVTLQIGLSLLAISLGAGEEVNRPYLSVFFTLLLPRGLGLGIMGMAIAIIRNQTGGMDFAAMRGIFQRLPFAWFGLFAATLTLVGFPLTAGFPASLALWQGLAVQFPLANYAALFGSAGLLFGGLRVLLVTLTGSSSWEAGAQESRGQRLFLAAGGMAVMLIGLLPQWFFPAIVRIASLYLRLE